MKSLEAQMCEWGTEVELFVLIPAQLSHTGELRWDKKKIDACIAPIVDALNNAGIYTASSCCGHGKGDGEILLHDGRELIIKNHATLISETVTYQIYPDTCYPVHHH